MAITSSNSTTLYPSSGYGYTLTSTFTENSTKIDSNTSSITVTAKLSCNGTYWTSSYNSTLEVYWYDNNSNNNGKLVASVSFTGMNNTSDSKTVSGTITVTHKSDGTLSGYAKAVFTKGATTSIYAPASGDVSTSNTELTKIPRYSVMSSANNFNDEDNPKITFSNPTNGYFSLRAKIGVSSNYNLISRDIPKTSTSYTFELTETERNTLRELCTDSNSLTVRLAICSMSGTTELSTSYLDKTMTIINGSPTFSDFTYKDINSVVTEITGNNQVLIKGLSILQVTIPSANKMVAIKKATPKNYVATIDDINKTIDYDTSNLDINLGVINSSGAKRLNVRAYDSRNNSTLVYKDIIVYDYNKPVVNASLTRLNNFENETTLKVNGTYSRLTINDTDKNVINKVQYRYREINGSWSEWITLNITTNDNKFTCNDIILSLDNTKGFEFEIQVTDNFETTTVSQNVDIGQAIFFISTNKKACYINGQEILTYDVIDSW